MKKTMFVLLLLLPNIVSSHNYSSSFKVNDKCNVLISVGSYINKEELEEIEENKGKDIKVLGGIVYDAARGKVLFINAPSVVIASGGLSSLYFPKTDTMRGNTGDSYALGIKAGADLLDMEQIQFLVQSHQLVEVKAVKKLRMAVMVDLVAVQADQAHQVGQVILLQ